MADDDKIVQLHRIWPLPAAEPASGLVDEMQASPVFGQAAAPPEIGQMEVGDLGFKDMEAAFNMRDWLQKACEAAGGRTTGGGFGGGCADIWIELEGHEYMVSIKPCIKTQ